MTKDICCTFWAHY